MIKQLIITGLMSALVTASCTSVPRVAAVVDTNGIKSTLAARFPKMTIVDVGPARMPGLYEVYTGKEIYYTDTNGDYLLQGTLLDARTQEDLTSSRLDGRNRIDFNSLPFERAIKIVKGNGARKFAIFTDPDCPYCRKFEEELKSVSDVTMYVFLYPIRIHPKAAQRARAIWCSDNRASAWTEYMQKKKEPAATSCSDDPISELGQLGERLNLSGTPTMYFANGERNSGGLTAQELQARLSATGG